MFLGKRGTIYETKDANLVDRRDKIVVPNQGRRTCPSRCTTGHAVCVGSTILSIKERRVGGPRM